MERGGLTPEVPLASQAPRKAPQTLSTGERLGGELKKIGKIFENFEEKKTFCKSINHSSFLKVLAKLLLLLVNSL